MGGVTSASKRRPRWDAVPAGVRRAIEDLVGGRVVQVEACDGGFSPGLAVRLLLSGGRRCFVKAIDGGQWPGEVAAYRDEARVMPALPASVPAPRLIGTIDHADWVVLAFEHVDGREPAYADLPRVIAELHRMQRASAAAPMDLPRDHPRLGGWAAAAGSPWVADDLDLLIALEKLGLEHAHGDTVVHFDLFPHNILVSDKRVWFVDWPHARLGSPLIDLVLLLSSVAADGLDPEPLLREHPVAAGTDPAIVNGIIAAHAGAFVGSALGPPPPGLEAIFRAKLAIGLPTLAWLRRRLVNFG